MPTERRRESNRPQSLVSVREVVRRRMGVESDTWDLALVQRAEVWDQVRMRHLFDSLLAGYPIGAILLCRVAGDSRAIRLQGGERLVVAAEADEWQLLDGQQRINALFSMFTDQGRYGRFFLNMAVRRQPPGPASRQSTKERALSYIAWYDPDTDAPEPHSRHLLIDLSRWFDWAEAHPEGPLDLIGENVARVLHSIDASFTEVLDPESAEVAVDRLARLWKVWSEPSIPVLSTEVETPLDVLEVFTRINLGGVQIAGADVYLAAVKTFWPDAERSLDRLASGSRFLDRMGALRFASRLISRAIRQGDLLPLTVDRLAGVRGEPLISAMGELTAADSVVNERVAAFTAIVESRSGLGYGLRLINRHLWDEVLAWAVSNDQADDTWFLENVPLIDAYLFGASLFRYPQTLGDRFERGAFLEAAVAGIAGEPFPLKRILSVTRGASGGLRGARGATIRSLDDEEDRQWLKDWNGGLLLSIAQRIPYQVERPIDWDHIFPQAQAQRMWTISEHGRRRHHPKRHFVRSTGNLWALDAGANRALQDTPPRRKFPMLAEWQLSNAYPVWARDQWSINDEEVEEFIEVDSLLTDDPAVIDVAMERFQTLIRNREDRLLSQAIEAVPDCVHFSADAPIEPIDPSPEPLDRLAKSLHLSERSHRLPGSDGTTPEVLGHEWAGRDNEVEWVFKEATRRHTLLTNPQGRALPAGAGDGFDLRRYVPVNGPVPYLLIGVVRRFAQIEPTPIWLQVPDTTEGFSIVMTRIDESPFAEQVRTDDGRFWLPLHVTSELEWTFLADQLFARIYEIRQVIEAPPTSP